MIRQPYRVLEFHRLLRILSGYISCPIGQKDCLSPKHSNDPEDFEIIGRRALKMKLLLKLKEFFLLKNYHAEGTCPERADPM